MSILAGHTIVGGSLSVIVIVKLQVVVFPEASVAVNSTVDTPIGNSLPEVRPEVCSTVTSQLSVAVASSKVTIAKLSPASVD